MDRNEFWTLVDSVRMASHGDERAFTSELFLRLAAMPIEAVRAFDAVRAAVDGVLGNLMVGDQDLHTVVHDAWGGCSDDSFMDFRSSVIANGRDYFEQMVADPVATLAIPPPTFALRFEAALFGPLHTLERELRAPVWNEGAWEPPHEAAEIVALLDSGDEEALRARFEDVLLVGPAWLFGVASSRLRQQLNNELGAAPESEPPLVREMLALGDGNVTQDQRNQRRRLRRSLRDNESVARYAAQRHLADPRANPWLDILDACGGREARLVFRTLAATATGDARLFALSSLSRHADAVGVVYNLFAAVSDSYGGNGNVKCADYEAPNDAARVLRGVVAGQDPRFADLFAEVDTSRVERAWRAAAEALLDDESPDTRAAFHAAHRLPERAAPAALCLALLGDTEHLDEVAELAKNPLRSPQDDLWLLNAIALHGPALGVPAATMDAFTSLDPASVAAGRVALSGGAEGIQALQQSVEDAVQRVLRRHELYAEGLTTRHEYESPLRATRSFLHVLRQHAPADAHRFEALLRDAAPNDLVIRLTAPTPASP